MPPPPTDGRGLFLPAALVIAAVAACAGYANLAYLVTKPADYRFFPPFQPGYNANDNGHLEAGHFNIAKALVAGRGFADPFPGQPGQPPGCRQFFRPSKRDCSGLRTGTRTSSLPRWSFSNLRASL